METAPRNCRLLSLVVVELVLRSKFRLKFRTKKSEKLSFCNFPKNLLRLFFSLGFFFPKTVLLVNRAFVPPEKGVFDGNGENDESAF